MFQNIASVKYKYGFMSLMELIQLGDIKGNSIYQNVSHPEVVSYII